MKINILIAFSLLTIYQNIKAQHYGKLDFSNIPKESVLTGKVIDEDLNVPMEYTNILLYSYRDSSLVTGTITDADGKFELKELPFGRFYLVANFIGYNKKTIPDIRLTLKQKFVDIGNISLKTSSVELEEVEIIGERKHIEFKLDKKIVNVSQDINATSGTAVDVLENTPSINVDIEGNVELRGSSSFTVLIDGRPSVLEGSDALQQIPASTIENIEIITNPSAKYDPDGIAGIINVVMKKQNRGGFNGILNSSIGTGDKYRGNFLINYKTSKFNIFGGIDYGNRKFSSDGNSRQENYYDTTFILLTESNRTFLRKGYEFKLGTDYYLDDMNTLSISGNYGYFGLEIGRDSWLHNFTDPSTIENYSVNESNFLRDRDYYRIHLNYQHKFDRNGHEISAYTYYSSGDGIEENYQNEYSTDEQWNRLAGNPNSTRSDEDDESQSMRFKIDYTKPLQDNGKFEAGFQSRLRYVDQNFIFEELDTTSGLWTINDLYSNDFEYKRNIHSIYSIYSSELIGLQFQIGLRGEYTDREITSKISDESYVIDRFDIFPSIHLSHKFPKEHQIQASYSRRIDRPRGWFLDPFISYSDPYNRRQGNPNLKPEYIDSYEIGYQKRFENSFFSVEAYYRVTHNMITRVRTLQENNIWLFTFENINNDFALGSELMANLYFTKWFQVNASTNFYQYKIEGELDSTEIDTKSTNWNARINTTFKITPVTRFQINTMYRGPSVTAQGERSEFFFTNFAVRQDFLKRKLTTTLQIRDIFQTMKREMTTLGDNFYSYDHFTREAPIVMLTLSFKINNYKNGRDRRSDDNEGGGYDEEF